MADNRDELDLEGSDVVGADVGAKKPSGIGALLPSLLKFVAIGLGAVIFVVTVTFVTFQILNSSGKAQSAVPTSPAYEPKKPQLSWFTNIGPIRTRTKDPTPYSVVANVILGYDLNNKVAQTELTNRLYELRDFVRSYLSNKTADELRPENEERLKIDLKELINNNIVVDTKVREVLFQQLDVVEM